jgi:hypothetical protein
MHGSPALGALDQAGARQHVEMLDHRRQRHLEASGDLRHRQLAVVSKPVEDRAPCRVRQRGKGPIELDVAKVNHVVKYRSGMPRGQDGVLHDRVHEAERRRTRLCGHIAEQPRPEPQKANLRRFACCNASEIARPRSPRAHQMRPVRRIQLSWHEPEHENVSLAVSAAGNLLPRLVTGGVLCLRLAIDMPHDLLGHGALLA